MFSKFISLTLYRTQSLNSVQKQIVIGRFKICAEKNNLSWILSYKYDYERLQYGQHYLSSMQIFLSMAEYSHLCMVLDRQPNFFQVLPNISYTKRLDHTISPNIVLGYQQNTRDYFSERLKPMWYMHYPFDEKKLLLNITEILTQ